MQLIDDVENVNRLAWSFGGNRQFDFGSLDDDLGEYTVEEVPLYYSSLPYPYTYYPTVFYNVEDGIMAIDYEQNYIGYKHGENNLSFMLDYSKTFLRNHTAHHEPEPLSLYADIEAGVIFNAMKLEMADSSETLADLRGALLPRESLYPPRDRGPEGV